MHETNHSMVIEFVLLGLSSYKELQPFLFVIFLLIYTGILLGNFLIILTVTSDARLHTPMYFLLGNLSFTDMCLASFATPKMIADFLVKSKTIYFEACLTQIFFLHLFGGGEMVLLVSMVYDHYVAICKPLHYMTIMRHHVCIMLVIIEWCIGLLHTLSQLAFTVNLPFCGPNQVDSFFCDLPLVTKVACIDTYVISLVVVANSGFLSMSSFVLLVNSYTVILITVRKYSSTSMAKAHSMLTAHITVVILYFGPCIFIYVWPFSSYSADKVLAVFYTIFTPILNLVIYTLRNKEVKSAMSKLKSNKNSRIQTQEPPKTPVRLVIQQEDRFIQGWYDYHTYLPMLRLEHKEMKQLANGLRALMAQWKIKPSQAGQLRYFEPLYSGSTFYCE
ncbi:olfactory receptor 4K15-like [Tamandua tetradactyla]|uniref:olfactory receptor 4K15-like n=1 Tax=Tamandua tetradactyla TaxID=48850 RepID=UPI0040547FE8